MSTSKTIAILNTQAPFATSIGKESLDTALIFGAYEQPTSLFFIGDGVFQMIGDQNPEQLEIKNYLKTFSALEFYDIDNVYICQQSLIERDLKTNFNIENIQVLDKTSFNQKLHQHNIIYRF